MHFFLVSSTFDICSPSDLEHSIIRYSCQDSFMLQPGTAAVSVLRATVDCVTPSVTTLTVFRWLANGRPSRQVL